MNSEGWYYLTLIFTVKVHLSRQCGIGKKKKRKRNKEMEQSTESRNIPTEIVSWSLTNSKDNSMEKE